MKLLQQVVIVCLFSIVPLLSFAASDAALGASVERYPLPQRGYFELKVPSAWRAEVSAPQKSAPPMISFAPREGPPFIITVTPVWRTAANKLVLNKEALRKRVEYALRGIHLFALERNIELVELKGASGPGFYFLATDKAPLAGGYKFMTKGEILVSDLSVVFNILTNEGQDSIVREALAMIQSANHIPAARSAAKTREASGSARKG